MMPSPPPPAAAAPDAAPRAAAHAAALRRGVGALYRRVLATRPAAAAAALLATLARTFGLHALWAAADGGGGAPAAAAERGAALSIVGLPAAGASRVAVVIDLLPPTPGCDALSRGGASLFDDLLRPWVQARPPPTAGGPLWGVALAEGSVARTAPGTRNTARENDVWRRLVGGRWAELLREVASAGAKGRWASALALVRAVVVSRGGGDVSRWSCDALDDLVKAACYHATYVELEADAAAAFAAFCAKGGGLLSDGCRVELLGTTRAVLRSAADAAAGGADPPPKPRALSAALRIVSPLLGGDEYAQLPADVAAAVADTLVALFSLIAATPAAVAALAADGGGGAADDDDDDGPPTPGRLAHAVHGEDELGEAAGAGTAAAGGATAAAPPTTAAAAADGEEEVVAEAIALAAVEVDVDVDEAEAEAEAAGGGGGGRGGGRRRGGGGAAAATCGPTRRGRVAAPR